jgi:hypothetical protein
MLSVLALCFSGEQLARTHLFKVFVKENSHREDSIEKTQDVKIYSNFNTSENGLLLAACPGTELANSWSRDAVAKNVCKRYLLNWRGAASIKEVERKIYQKLLLPFSDVVCFIAENLANTAHRAKEIINWAAASNGTSFVGQARHLGLSYVPKRLRKASLIPMWLQSISLISLILLGHKRVLGGHWGRKTSPESSVT